MKLALLLATLTACVFPTQAKPLKIFILAGQSNMEGPASIKTFDYIGDDPATAPMLKMMRGAEGKPKEAIDWLLHPTHLNNYSPGDFCADWYLPGNDGLLWAAAMMTAGWDGCPGRPAPGFPDDGTWAVKWEGLKKTP